MCAEASTTLRAVAADFFFNCWYLEILWDNRIRHTPRCVHYHAQGFRLNRSRISMLEVEAVAQSCIPQVQIGLSTHFVLYMRDRLCLVVRVLGYRPGGPGSIPGTTRKKVVGLERGPLSFVSTTEELLDRKVAAPV
jgi:hypothetical protein